MVTNMIVDHVNDFLDRFLMSLCSVGAHATSCREKLRLESWGAAHKWRIENSYILNVTVPVLISHADNISLSCFKFSLEDELVWIDVLNLTLTCIATANMALGCPVNDGVADSDLNVVIWTKIQRYWSGEFSGLRSGSHIHSANKSVQRWSQIADRIFYSISEEEQARVHGNQSIQYFCMSTVIKQWPNGVIFGNLPILMIERHHGGLNRGSG